MIGHEMTRRIVGFVWLLGLLLGPVATTRAEMVDSPWPTLHHDARRTGRSTTLDGPISSHVQVKWKYHAGPSGISTSPTIGTDGTIYFGWGFAPICALNPDGTKKWCMNNGHGGIAVQSSPTIGVDPTSTGPGGGPVLYMGARDNRTWAVKDNGPGSFILQWRNKIDQDGDVLSTPLIDPENDTVYTACGCVGSGHVRALDPTPADTTDGPGEIVWDQVIDAGIRASSPALDDRPFAPIGSATANPHYRRIYIGSLDGVLHAFTPDGQHKWSFATGAANNNSTPMIADDGVIYVGSFNGVTAVVDDGNSAHAVWTFLSAGKVETAPTLGQDGTIYAGTTSTPATLHAINPTTGREKWHVGNLGAIWSSPAVGKNGTIYVAAGKKLYAFKDNGTSASIVWSLTMPNVMKFSSPAIGDDGVLYIGCSDHNVYAIEDKP